MDGEIISCSPCEGCNWTGELRLAPVAPPLPPGDEGRACAGCTQRFRTWEWCGHNVTWEEWYCSPGCYAETTGDTRPWDQPRPFEIPVIYIRLFR